MDILLDTHMLLWWMADDPRLSSKARRLIADRQNTLIVSTATGWEITIKQGLGKLIMHRSWRTAIEAEGFAVLPIALQHAEETLTLPDIHRDPFDRMLVAQAPVENVALLTVDRRIVRYPTNVIEGWLATRLSGRCRRRRRLRFAERKALLRRHWPPELFVDVVTAATEMAAVRSEGVLTLPLWRKSSPLERPLAACGRCAFSPATPSPPSPNPKEPHRTSRLAKQKGPLGDCVKSP